MAVTFHEGVSAPADRDILVYVAFPVTSADAHAAVLPAVLRAAAVLGASSAGASPFDVALFDGDANDAPPPHATGAREPTLVLYPAGAKGTPRYVQRFSEGQLTLYDVLYFVAATAGHGNTTRAAALALQELPSEELLARPWEAAAEEFEDEAWHRRGGAAEEEEEEEEEHESEGGAPSDEEGDGEL